EVGRGALLIRALVLLTQGEQSLQNAQRYLANEDFVNADYEVTLFQGTIPELFCCQALGEGFATVIVALNRALKNRRGDPLSRHQLLTLTSCVTRLRKEIFLSYETALDLIDALEATGLNTDLSIAAPLATLLLDEEDREPEAANGDNR